MKIIQITPSYKPAYIYGGTIRSVAKLCEALAKRKAENGKCENTLKLEVLTTTANGKVELAVETGKPILVDGVNVTYFNRWTKDHSHFSPGLLWGLRKEIFRQIFGTSAGAQDDKKNAQDEKPVVHIHAWWNLVSLLSCLIAKCYKIPVVLSPRGMLTGYSQNNRNSISKKLLHHLIGKRLLQYCYIHATSEQEKREIENIVTPKNIWVIPNLVNIEYQVSSIKYQEKVATSEYQEQVKAESLKVKVKSMEHKTGSIEQEAENNCFKLIFLSRIEEKKGLELLFDSLALLDIEWVLTIAGSGEDAYVESLKQKAEWLKLSNRISWIGQVSNEDKFGILYQNDLLVLTSYNENFANVVIESLSVGTPVLVSDQVGLSDYGKEKDLVWVTNLDKDNITSRILGAFHNNEKRQQIRQTAPAIIREDFSDVVLVEQYAEMYKSVIGD